MILTFCSFFCSVILLFKDGGDCTGNSRVGNNCAQCFKNTVHYSGKYRQRFDGNGCYDRGKYSLYDIEDVDECKEALRALGFEVLSSSSIRIVESSFSYPTGCSFYRNGNRFYLNKRKSSSYGCSSYYTCICSGSSSTKSIKTLTCGNGGPNGRAVSCANSKSPKSGSTVCGTSSDDICSDDGPACCIPLPTCGNGGPNGRAVLCTKSVSAKPASTKCGQCRDDMPECCVGLTKESDICSETRCNSGGGGDMCKCGIPSNSIQGCCNYGMGLCPACPPKYRQITSGTCNDLIGYSTIFNKAACQTAANDLGFSQTTATNVYSFTTPNAPRGCYSKQNGASLFYMHDSGGVCREGFPEYRCICQKNSRRRMNDNDSTDSTVQTIQQTVRSPSLNNNSLPIMTNTTFILTSFAYGFHMPNATENMSLIITKAHSFRRILYTVPELNIGGIILGMIVLLWLSDLFKLRSMLDTT